MEKQLTVMLCPALLQFYTESPALFNQLELTEEKFSLWS